MKKYRHIMVDIETTGVDPSRNGILQIAAWRFDLVEGEIDPNPFNKCLQLPSFRHWSEQTRTWWHDTTKMQQTLFAIQQRAENPATVLKEFIEWVDPSTQPIFWSKPSHFDFMFIQSYFADYGMPNPFHYRHAQDMNSFIRGLHFPEQPPAVMVQMEGAAHDAVYDALNQIQVIWEHLSALGREREDAVFQAKDIVAEVVK